VLRDLECAVDACFTIFAAVPVFTAEGYFLQMFVARLKILVLVKAAAVAVTTEEAFVFEAVDLVLRGKADWHIKTGLYDRCYRRLRRVSQVDIGFRRRTEDVVVVTGAYPNSHVKVGQVSLALFSGSFNGDRSRRLDLTLQLTNGLHQRNAPSMSSIA
jgi:hypothetical protein